MKVSKKVSNSQKTQIFELARQMPASADLWRAKRGSLSDILTSIVAKHRKIEGGPFWEMLFLKKVSQ